MAGTRAPAVAGSFYPGDQMELRQMINGYLKQAEEDKGDWLHSQGKPSKKRGLRGIIVPHAGYVYSGPVAAYGYALLKHFEIPKRIIILGPSHYAAFPGLAESGYDSWSTPLGDILSFSIIDKKNSATVVEFPPAHDPEHSLEVQLPFLQVALEGKSFKVDPILTGEVGPRSGADALAEAIKDAFLIVSSDLSHYMPYKEACAKDAQTLGIIDSMDPDRFLKQGDACGRTGISIAIALAKKIGWKIEPLRYANSGDTAGPKSEVVGYAALAIYEA
jgi:AmmeMemoRadiSam system protein B